MDLIGIENIQVQINGLVERIRPLNIPRDPTTTEAQRLIRQLTEVFTEARLLYGDVHDNLEQIERTISQVEKLARGQGNNADQRVANGVLAVQEFNTGTDEEPELVNLYEMQNHYSRWDSKLKSVLDIIKDKQERIITLVALMRTEAGLQR